MATASTQRSRRTSHDLVLVFPYFTALQSVNNLETKRSYKRAVNLKNLNFLQKSMERFKNYSLIC